jgi:pilus assembly protein Flp/PilA
MKKLIEVLGRFVYGGEEGATMVEYGLMLVLIAAVCVGIIATIGTNTMQSFQTIVNAF